MTPQERAYWAEYRRRPEVMARERERARQCRAQPGGAEANRDRVKANRRKLGRAYLAQLISAATGVPQREISPAAIDAKREQILVSRALAIVTKAVACKERRNGET